MKIYEAGTCIYRCLFAVWGTLLVIAPASAQSERGLDLVFGTWGTQNQCDHDPIKAGGTLLAQPFEFSGDWLRHGSVWCHLKWFDPDIRENGIFVVSKATCGEDARRRYNLGILLDNSVEPVELTLFWDEDVINGPLLRCEP